MKLFRVLGVLCIFLMAIGNSKAQINDLSENQEKMDTLWSQVKKYHKDSPDIALDYANQLLAISIEEGDKSRQADATWSIAFITKSSGDLSASIKHFFNALDLYRKLSRYPDIASAYYNIARIFKKVGDYENALTFYKEALNLYLQENQIKKTSSASYDMGMCYIRLQKYDSAESYLNRTISIGSPVMQRCAYNRMGILFYEQHKYSSAIEQYQIVLSMAREQENERAIGMALHNIGESYFMQGNYDQARDFLWQAMTAKKAEGDPERILSTQLLLTKMALDHEDFGSNVSDLKVAIANMNTNEVNQTLSESLAFIQDVAHDRKYEKFFDRSDLLKYLEMQTNQNALFNEITSSLESQKNKFALHAAVTQYYSEEEKKQLEARNQDTLYLITAVILMFSLIIGIVSYLRYRKKQYRQLEHQSSLEDFKEAYETMKSSYARLSSEYHELKQDEEESKNLMQEAAVRMAQLNDLMRKMNSYHLDFIIKLTELGIKPPVPNWKNDLNDRNN
ncbi:tetratricopeptide repeat protein [Fulvivirgaceae bacterium BMA10]|uniref:Tetratricopeptide repeat protein n=1 Tax=Splendidivirga corallicola TaxID=3051826 RepID=A0ABT8KKS6_9BACT|nr:tetratricopeptide repeat protein [Fulvivirgaceae bacterium BMA10]